MGTATSATPVFCSGLFSTLDTACAASHIIGCADRMEEVRVLAVSVRVRLNSVPDRLLLLVLDFPVVITIVTLGRLQSLQHRLVISDDPGQILYAHLAIERVVLVQC